jgi:threonyl-tRNA synthetase
MPLWLSPLQALVATITEEADIYARELVGRRDARDSVLLVTGRDYEHERADRMVAAQDRLVAKLETLRSLLAAIQEAARPRTSWLGGWRWLRKAS